MAAPYKQRLTTRLWSLVVVIQEPVGLRYIVGLCEGCFPSGGEAEDEMTDRMTRKSRLIHMTRRVIVDLVLDPLDYD